MIDLIIIISVQHFRRIRGMRLSDHWSVFDSDKASSTREDADRADGSFVFDG